MRNRAMTVGSRDSPSVSAHGTNRRFRRAIRGRPEATNVQCRDARRVPRRIDHFERRVIAVAPRSVAVFDERCRMIAANPNRRMAFACGMLAGKRFARKRKENLLVGVVRILCEIRADERLDDMR
jgi:hypothetical protein